MRVINCHKAYKNNYIMVVTDKYLALTQNNKVRIGELRERCRQKTLPDILSIGFNLKI